MKQTFSYHAILLLLCATVIFSLGLVLVFDTSSAEVLNLSLDTSPYGALVRQIMYAVIGIIVAFVASIMGYRSFIRLSFFFLCITTLFLILVFVPGIGLMRNGANRWIGFAGYTFQPSEFAKFVVPMFFLSVVLRTEGQVLRLRMFMKTLAICAIPIMLILLEPDHRTTGIIITTLMVVFFLTRQRLSYWAWPVLVMIIVGGGVGSQVPYVKGRVHSFMNPEEDLLGKGHQPYQAKIAAGSGKLFGKGVGQSLQKLNYLPEAQNDYIAAIYAEEFGFIGMLVLLSLYMLMAYLGYSIAHHAVDLEGFYLGMLLTFLLAIQVFLNLGVVSGLLPSTGLNLPLFSQGGTSLMVDILAIGLLLKIAQESRLHYSGRLGNIVKEGTGCAA